MTPSTPSLLLTHYAIIIDDLGEKTASPGARTILKNYVIFLFLCTCVISKHDKISRASSSFVSLKSSHKKVNSNSKESIKVRSVGGWGYTWRQWFALTNCEVIQDYFYRWIFDLKFNWCKAYYETIIPQLYLGDKSIDECKNSCIFVM